jgi:hypothetical protein
MMCTQHNQPPTRLFDIMTHHFFFISSRLYTHTRNISIHITNVRMKGGKIVALMMALAIESRRRRRRWVHNRNGWLEGEMLILLYPRSSTSIERN